jgi:hypothetical protein
MKNKVTGYDAKFAEITEKFATDNTSIETKFNAIKEIVDAIAEEPAAPIATPANSTFKAHSVIDRFNDFKKLKNK